MRRRLDAHRGRLVDCKRVARAKSLEPAKCNGIPGPRRPPLDRLLSSERTDAANPFAAPGRVHDGRPVGDLARQHARERKLSAVTGVIALHHIGCALGARYAEPLGGFLHEWHLVPQRLQQAEDPVPVFRAANQNGTDEPLPEVGGEIVEHMIIRRLHIRQQLFHQRIVVVGKLLQHMEARLLLAIGDTVGKRHDLAWSVLAIDVGALGGEVDKTGCDPVLPNRDLPQDKRSGGSGLQHRYDVAHGC